jgi:hypothetical protein
MPDSGRNDLNPTPVHGRGCDLSLIPKAADLPATDLKEILGVDSANPFLRALRIERGFLKVGGLPRELTHAAPLDSAALAKLRVQDK